jgi:hypothetical protein
MPPTVVRSFTRVTMNLRNPSMWIEARGAPAPEESVLADALAQLIARFSHRQRGTSFAVMNICGRK